MPIFGKSSDSRIKEAQRIVKWVSSGEPSSDEYRLFHDRFLKALHGGKSKSQAYEEALRQKEIDDFLASGRKPWHRDEEDEEDEGKGKDVVALPSPTGEWRRDNPRWRSKEMQRSVVERPIPGLHLDRAKIRAVLRECPDEREWSYGALKDETGVSYAVMRDPE